MSKLYELLAAEASVTSQYKKLLEETRGKFIKVDSYFRGHVKTLAMLEDSPQNKVLEQAARQEKTLSTNVPETLEYLLGYWAKSEDVLFQKNKTNQLAKADIAFRGNVLVKDVPVDELMGLEARFKELRGLAQEMPTHDASKTWNPDTSRGKGYWVAAQDEVTSKTEKIFTPMILAPATDKHPAQVKEGFTDKPVGSFTLRSFSGAATAAQKAELLDMIDDLIIAVRQARNQANTVDTVNEKIGSVFTSLLMSVFN